MSLSPYKSSARSLTMAFPVLSFQSLLCFKAARQFLVLGNMDASFPISSTYLFLGFPSCLFRLRLPSGDKVN
jgi:hypothetical protein